MEDVGKFKSDTAAKRVMQRVAGCEVTAHVGRIEERDNDFYEQFAVIILGLDSLEARRYMNHVACSFLGAPPPAAAAAAASRRLACSQPTCMHAQLGR